MVEIAAKHDNPHSELNRLYAASVLPEEDITDDTKAWLLAQKFTKKALQYNRAGILSDTAEFPHAQEVKIIQEPAVIKIDTNKPQRSYFIKGYFHAKNRYGTKVRLDLTVRLRTDFIEWYDIFQLLVSDPSRPLLSSIVVKNELDRWDGFEILRTPDSLKTQLDALIEANKKQ